MKPITRLAGLLLTLTLFLSAQSKKDSDTVETEHYIVHTTGEKAHAKELADFMELVYKTYSALLQYDKEIPRKFTIRLYRDHAEFREHNQAQKGALAFYSPQTKELVGAHDPYGMFAIFAHEGMHQFTDMVMPNFSKVPTWYSEGIADCIGNCEVRGKKLYMCTVEGYIASMRIITIQTAIRQNRTPSLKEFLRLSKDQHYANGRLHYAMGWSFCHFLMTYPRVEERSQQIPKGAHKPIIAELHKLLAAGVAPEEAYTKAFRIGNKPVDWDKFEETWKKYILTFPDPLAKTLLEGLSVDLDAIKDKEPDGIHLGDISPDSPAGKSGLQTKDVIIGLDGEKVIHWGEFIPPLRKKKPGETATVKIQRQGQEMDLKVEFPKK